MLRPDLKVLIVDDLPEFRKILKTYLRSLGLKQVTESGDGQAAWKKLQEASSDGNPFELVICDERMPSMRGMELLQLIRNSLELRTTPVVLLTAENELVPVQTAIDLAVDDYVIKPFTVHDLEQRLIALFQKRSED